MLKSELDSEMLKRRQIDASIVAKVSRLKALGGGESTTNSTEKMYYILGDCAGEMSIDTEREVILLSELLDGLIVEDDGTDAGDAPCVQPSVSDWLHGFFGRPGDEQTHCVPDALSRHFAYEYNKKADGS